MPRNLKVLFLAADADPIFETGASLLAALRSFSVLKIRTETGEAFESVDAPVYSAEAALEYEKYAVYSLAALDLACCLNWFPHFNTPTIGTPLPPHSKASWIESWRFSLYYSRPVSAPQAAALRSSPSKRARILV